MIDSSNMLGVLENFPKQCKEALTLTKGISVSKEIDNIVICGMGGSSIGGALLKSCLANLDIPVTILRNYDLPKYIDDKSLVFAISYSGNTEETMSALIQAKERKAETIGITSGGMLAEEVDKVIKIPADYQPRAAVGYLFFPMLGVLYNSNLIDIRNDEVNEALKALEDVEYYKEEGKKLARLIGDRVPVIYSSELFEPVAYRFKTQINENAKSPAFNNVFPEMNHNEINAFKFMDRKRFVGIMIRDSGDHPRIQKRMDICKKIMEDNIDVVDMVTKGKSLLTRMFSTIYLGDMTSYYLALDKRVDPTPVEVIETLKKKLKE